MDSVLIAYDHAHSPHVEVVHYPVMLYTCQPTVPREPALLGMFLKRLPRAK